MKQTRKGDTDSDAKPARKGESEVQDGSQTPTHRDVPILRHARARADEAVRRSQRIAEAEALLGAGKTERDVRRHIAEKYGITLNAAYRYVRAVHMLWDGEGKRLQTPEARTQKRAHLESMLMTAIEAGLARQDMKLDKDGGEHFTANPDTRGVVAAIETLARMHALIEPETKSSGSQIPQKLIVVLQKHYGIDPALGQAMPRLQAQGVAVIDAIGEDDG